MPMILFFTIASTKFPGISPLSVVATETISFAFASVATFVKASPPTLKKIPNAIPTIEATATIDIVTKIVFFTKRLIFCSDFIFTMT